jgi:hypothetical protein
VAFDFGMRNLEIGSWQLAVGHWIFLTRDGKAIFRVDIPYSGVRYSLFDPLPYFFAF